MLLAPMMATLPEVGVALKPARQTTFWVSVTSVVIVSPQLKELAGAAATLPREAGPAALAGAPPAISRAMTKMKDRETENAFMAALFTFMGGSFSIN